MVFQSALVIFALCGVSVVAGWGYKDNGANSWPSTYSTCGGTKQSPIDIRPGQAIFTPSLGNITMVGFDSPVEMTLINNGHTVKVSVTENMTINNGGLGAEYTAAQFHFHWGSDNTKGSEHTINGEAFPMEMHIVHYKTSLGSVSNAAAQANGLAVLGYMFTISGSDNAAFSNLITKLSDVQQPNSSNTVALTPVAMDTLLPTDATEYIRYSGSLTTPGCNEVVMWTVFTEKIEISANQMNSFRALLSSETDSNNNQIQLENNYRPVQAVHGRRIISNYDAGSSSLVPITMLSSVFISVFSYMISK